MPDQPTESLVSRLREMAADARAAAYGAHSIEQAGIANQRAEDLTKAANRIEELEARSSLLVEAGEEFERVTTPDPQPDRGERRWTIAVCPRCGSRCIDEEHADIDGSPRGYYCERCEGEEFDPQVLEVVPASDLEHLQARVEELERDLAECYRLSGADPDGDSDAMLARHAVQACREGREEWDECAGELLAAEQTIAAVREELKRRAKSDIHPLVAQRLRAALDLLRGEGET